MKTKLKKKVLIITYYWPPAGGSGVQRWVKFAKYLRDFGWEPIVYAPKNADYPLKDESLLTESPDDIKVIKHPIWEPYKIASIFSSKKERQHAGFLEDQKRLSFFQRKILWIRANWFIPDGRKFWITPSVKFLAQYLSENPVDAIVTNGPPHSMHMIGLGLTKHHNIPWLADFRDPWTSIDYLHRLPLTNKAIQKHTAMEKEVLRVADKVIVVSNSMREEFLDSTDNVEVILNGHDLPLSDREEVALDAEFSIVHVGLMNADRNPIRLWRVLSQLSTENERFKECLKIKLVGEVSEAVSDDLKEYKLEEKVEYVRYLPHKQVHGHQQKAQLLLLAVNNVPGAKGIVTGKVFEYMAADRPIIAIGPEDGDLANLLRESKAGLTFDFSEEEALKTHIIALFDAYLQGDLNGTSQHAERYSRRNLAQKMANALNEISQ